MPTVVRQISQKVFAELNNGSTFALNSTDFANHFKGSVNERLQVVSRVQIGSWVELRRYKWQLYNSNTTARLTMSGANFDEAFAAGDTAKITFYNNDGAVDVTITQVTSEWMDLVIGTTYGTGFPPSNTMSSPIYADAESNWITNTTNITGLEYKFGLIENDEPTNYNSKLTNTEQMYRFSPIPTIGGGGTISGEAAGTNKAWVTGNITVEFIGEVADNNQVAYANTWKEYEIKHSLIVNPLYRDGEIVSLNGTDDAPGDIFKGTKSLKYVYECGFMKDITDPNSKKIGSWSSTIGSIGYYNESFNGFSTPYTLNTISYYNVTDSEDTDRIQVGKVTRVTAYIDDSSNSLTNTTAFVIGHSAIIDSTKYTYSDLEYQTLWTNKTVRNVANASIVSNGFIKDSQAALINTGRLEVIFDIDFSVDEIARLEEGQDYILDFIIQKDGQNVNSGSKTNVRLGVNQYGKNADIAGLLDFEILEHYAHPQSLFIGGYTNAKMDIEEGLRSKGEFWLDLSKGAFLETLEFQLVLYNTVTSQYQVFRRYQFDLSDQVLVNGVQQIELSTTRGYKLAEDDPFNQVIITTGMLVGSKQYYEVYIGWKTPWQEWVEFAQADPIFYDRTKPFNGLNNLTTNYSGINDYYLRAAFSANVSSEGVVTNYVKLSENFEVWGYDEDDQPPSTYTCNVKTYDADGNELEGGIIDGRFTELRGEFTPAAPPVFSSSVDFTNVSSNWSRYAHGNKWVRNDGFFERLPNWDNDQADDVDHFTGFNLTPTINKNEPTLYTTTTNQILANDNLAAVYGLYSPEKYEYYQITGTMFSTAADDDVIKYDIAFFIDEEGVEHTLSLCATGGGHAMNLEPTFDPNDINSSCIAGLPQPSEQFVTLALMYNYGKRDVKRLDIYLSPEVRDNWANIGECNFDVRRSSNEINIDIDWTIKGTNYTPSFSYNLNDNPETLKFKGGQSIGFSFQSQDLGGFKNVTLVLPQDSFWGVLRAQIEGSTTDESMAELSSVWENNIDNLLIQTQGDEVKALLSWDGVKFVVKGQFNIPKVEFAQRYKLSAEIGEINLTE